MFHAGAEVGHEEVVQHIVRPHQHLDRATQRQMHLVADDDDVVLAGRIGRIDTEWVAAADEACVAPAQLAAVARKTVAPLPLRANHFEHHRLTRRLHVSCIDHQSGRQQRNDAHRGDADQPALQRLVLGFVAGPLAFTMAEAPQRVDNKQIDDDEKDAGDHQRDRQRVVHCLPVRRQRREPPRGDQMKDHRTDDEHQQRDRDGHGMSLKSPGGAESGLCVGYDGRRANFQYSNAAATPKIMWAINVPQPRSSTNQGNADATTKKLNR